MDHSTPGSLAAERSDLEVFLSLPLNMIDPDIGDGRGDEVRRMLAPGRQRDLDEDVTFNSGI